MNNILAPFPYYFLPSLLVSLVIFIALFISGMHHLVIVASVGSTAFIVFMTPQKRIARPKISFLAI